MSGELEPRSGDIGVAYSDLPKPSRLSRVLYEVREFLLWDLPSLVKGVIHGARHCEVCLNHHASRHDPFCSCWACEHWRAHIGIELP